MARPTYRV